MAAYHLVEALLEGYGSPRRTVMVAAWNGEEIGLLGSCAYVRQPLHSMFHTTAVINIEMLSSGDSGSVLAYGLPLDSAELAPGTSR